ncbi:hypothetical protein NDU88_000551 [Pleurodeles waltl]|uniref:Uncharacterized protein n=1 Tax=Pleurodeles waltl TaxID=8319 RepID=A0AAV7TFB2_PLEWA|nr:hypothetical protein NDU88_000551 [Pleurodeles waltl]
MILHMMAEQWKETEEEIKDFLTYTSELKETLHTVWKDVHTQLKETQTRQKTQYDTRRSAPDRTYSGGTDQGAGVEVKPLRHDGSMMQGAGPLIAGRRRELKYKERPEDEEDEEEEDEFGENTTMEEEMGGKLGNEEEDEFGVG